MDHGCSLTKALVVGVQRGLLEIVPCDISGKQIRALHHIIILFFSGVLVFLKHSKYLGNIAALVVYCAKKIIELFAWTGGEKHHLLCV